MTLKPLRIKTTPGTVVISADTIVIWCYFILAAVGGMAVVHGDNALVTGSVRSTIAAVLIVVTVGAWGVQLLLRQKIYLSLAILVPIAYYLVINLDVRGTAAWNYWTLIRLAGFLLLSAETKRRVYELYRKFLILMSGIGIVIFLAYTLSLPLPYREVEYYGALGGEYIDYALGYLYSSDGSIRLCGLFNEPGYLGTVLALVLCVENLNLKKPGNLIMLAAGACTVSMAFVMLLVVYFVLRNYKRPKWAIPLLLLAVFYFFILPNITFENQQIAKFVSRFTFVDGEFAGDNRSNIYVEETLNKVMYGKDMWWGYGGGYSSDNFAAVSTYKTYLIDYGILGFALMYGLYFVAAMLRTRWKEQAVIFCLCFFLSVYQRPNIYAMLYFVVLFGGIEAIHHRKALKEVAS